MYITAESINELCKRHGLTVNELKLQLRLLHPYMDYLESDKESDALVYKGERYYRKK